MKAFLSAQEIATAAGVSLGAVRKWILLGKLLPVKREGQGRGGGMVFSRGSVAALVYSRCALCGKPFRRSTLRARFCSARCRGKAHRIKQGG